MKRYGRLLIIEALETRLPFDVDMTLGLLPDNGHVELGIWRSETPFTTTGVFTWQAPGIIETRVPFDWPGDEPTAQDARLPSYSETSVTIIARAADDEGTELHDVTVGQEFWIELSAQGNRVHEQGVFDARFKVELNTSSLALLPQVEPMSGYVNGMSRVRTPTGFSELGGFSSSFAPLGPEARPVVRFKVRAIEPGNTLVEVSNPALEWHPFLVYGDDLAVDPKNVSPATLVLNISDPPSIETLDPVIDRTTSSSESAGEQAFVYAPQLVNTAITHVSGYEPRADLPAIADRERPQAPRSPMILPAEPLDETTVVHSLPSEQGIEPENSEGISLSLRPETKQSPLKV